MIVQEDEEERAMMNGGVLTRRPGFLARACRWFVAVSVFAYMAIFNIVDLFIKENR